MILGLANLLGAYIAYDALLIPPAGIWDDHNLTGISVASLLLILLGLGTALITLIPVRRRRLGYGWLVPPVFFLVAGVARLWYINDVYPVGPGG
ncbi:hypothetical protein SLA_4180 [Streptomyces laurentii]|uniref:Integral membrane protein n=1 Tax=Streptomyces laurentii TaxID=39478 RepID=A0A169NR08_STRLU|nr:hypothetical protein SLA_4180 [Streptomyces laurentii]